VGRGCARGCAGHGRGCRGCGGCAGVGVWIGGCGADYGTCWQWGIRTWAAGSTSAIDNAPARLQCLRRNWCPLSRLCTTRRPRFAKSEWIAPSREQARGPRVAVPIAQLQTRPCPAPLNGPQSNRQ
jgi:hypothetical protein